MDVYLSREALEELEALRAFTAKGEGILRGHKRGQRFFVEHILPIPGVVSASEAKLRHVQDIYSEAFLGFFSTDPGPAKKAKAQTPGTVGKVLLEIGSREEEKPVWRAFLFDFDGEFRLVPIKIKKAS
jgi:hypothetical protein